MGQLTSSLLVKLIDGVTGPARAAAASVKGIGQAMRQVSGIGTGSLTAGLERAIEKNRRSLAQLRGSLFDATAMGYGLYKGLSKPLSLARDFETAMLDIGQKAELSTAQMAALRQKIIALAPTINKTAQETAGAMDILLGKGLDADTSLGMIGSIGRAATAYHQPIEDLAEAAYSMHVNMGVAVKDLPRALDIMSQAGKEGSFEIGDMAREFPALTVGAKKLGLAGADGLAKLTAALQVARIGAGTSAQAATNVANLFQKVLSPQTTHAFKKLGIDIRKEFKASQKKGEDFFTFVDRVTNKALKGDWSKLGDVFQDAEVQKAVLALHQQMEQYLKIRDKVMGASGVVDKDFADRMLTGQAQLERFTNTMNNLGLVIGSIILPPVNELLSRLTDLSKIVATFADAHPGLVKTLVAGASALTAYRVASIGLRYGLGLTKGGLLDFALASTRVAKGIGKIGLLPFRLAFRGLAATAFTGRKALVGLAGAMSILGMRGGALVALKAMPRAIVGLLNPLRLVRVALMGVRAAVVGTGIGAVLVGIALAGTWIYNNWSGIAAMFKGFADEIKTQFPGLVPMVDGVSVSLGKLVDLVSNLTGTINASEATWRSWGVAAADALKSFSEHPFTALYDGLRGIAQSVTPIAAQINAALVAGLGNLFDVGVQWIKGLVSGIISGIAAQVGLIRSAAQSINDAIKSAMPGPTAAFGRGAGGKPAASVPSAPVNGMRAKGGDVKAGKTYGVGERGIELFTPRRSGTITPNHKMAAGGQGGGLSLHVKMGNIIVQGAADARAVAEQVGQHLEQKLAAITRGIHSDLGYTA